MTFLMTFLITSPISGSFESDLKVILEVVHRFYLVYFTSFAFKSRDITNRDEDIKKAKRLIFNYRFFWTTKY